MVGKLQKKNDGWKINYNTHPTSTKIYETGEMCLHPKQIDELHNDLYGDYLVNKSEEFYLWNDKIVSFEIVKFCFKHGNEYNTDNCDDTCVFDTNNVALLDFKFPKQEI